MPEIGHIDPVNLEPREVNKRQGRAFPFTPPFNFSGQPSLSLPLETGQLQLADVDAGVMPGEVSRMTLAAQLAGFPRSSVHDDGLDAVERAYALARERAERGVDVAVLRGLADRL